MIHTLKNIPSILSPDLMKILMEMGHGDEIVLSDGNYPASTYAKKLVRYDGNAIPELLDAILKFFPLDSSVENPVSLMSVESEHFETPSIWSHYRSIIQKYKPDFTDFEMVERSAFYERSKKAFAIVNTGEKALYANILLTKGVVTD